MCRRNVAPTLDWDVPRCLLCILPAEAAFFSFQTHKSVHILCTVDG